MFRQAQIESILRHEQKCFHGGIAPGARRGGILRHPVARRKGEYRRTRREISEVLNPDQQAKFKSWRKGDKGDKDGKSAGENKQVQKSGDPADEKQKCCIKPTLLDLTKCL